MKAEESRRVGNVTRGLLSRIATASLTPMYCVLGERLVVSPDRNRLEHKVGLEWDLNPTSVFGDVAKRLSVAELNAEATLSAPVSN